MIFYFTGTGNSLFAAKCISSKLNERLVSIAECMRDKNFIFQCDEDEKIGFVYPIHGWRPPKIVLDFIKKLVVKNGQNKYVYSIFTYAGRCEAASRVLASALKKRNLILNGSYKILMPGNMPGANNKIPQEENERRINDEERECYTIAEDILNGKGNYVKGKYSLIRSHLIGNYAYRLFPQSIKFTVNNKCKDCRLCIKSCPGLALKKEDNKIVRDASKCLMCMKCINCCPNEAIEFGKETIGKKRYKHPKYKMLEM